MTPFALLTPDGLAVVSPGIADASLDAVESMLGGTCDTVCTVSSPDGERGALTVYGLAEPDANAEVIHVRLASGTTLAVRGPVAVTADDATGQARALTPGEWRCLHVATHGVDRVLEIGARA